MVRGDTKVLHPSSWKDCVVLMSLKNYKRSGLGESAITEVANGKSYLSILNLVYFSHKPAGIFKLMKPRFILKILFAKHDIHSFYNCAGREFQHIKQNVCLFVFPTCVSLYPLPLSTTKETSYILPSRYTI